MVSALAWAWLLAGAGMEMSALEMTHHSQMDMPYTQPAPWTPGYAVLMFLMWWIMMVAMMLPSATPVILLAAHVNRRARSDQPPYGPTSGFAAGYLLAWGAFSAVATAIQWSLEHTGLLNAMMVMISAKLGGLILMVAGAWQFTPWKRACLRHCRNPVEFLSNHHRAGAFGALRMGVSHGAFCLGCCWFLMALLFVGGIMNLYWIIGLTLYVCVEKLLPGGRWVPRAMGALLICWGALVIASG